MGNIEHGIWHKDGPVAQIEAMIEWLNDPLDAEHRRKVQTNLRASADSFRGAVSPEVAATAATLVDMMKRNLPPHITEAQQVEAYLALRRIATGGQ